MNVIPVNIDYRTCISINRKHSYLICYLLFGYLDDILVSLFFYSKHVLVD